jgi:2-polyprenyl-3-methyl-5-hydroxy-6-metoxy-1,4-benzoquinol methylase
MNKTELYKVRSRNFFDRVANTNYGNSPNLDESILSITKFEEGDVLLDIGCGQGRFSEKVHSANKNISCFGLDLSKEMIRIASEKATENRYSFEMTNYFYVHHFLFVIKFKRSKENP